MKNKKIEIFHNERSMTCNIDVFSDVDKKSLIILKCINSQSSSDLTNYIDLLSLKAMSVSDNVDIKNIIFAMYYPEDQNRNMLPMESLVVISFDKDMNPRFSRSITITELSQ